MKRPKYPLLPRSIILQPNNRYKCCKTGKWYSSKELERYAIRDEETPQITEEDKHTALLLKRWDLNY